MYKIAELLRGKIGGLILSIEKWKLGIDVNQLKEQIDEAVRLVNIDELAKASEILAKLEDMNKKVLETITDIETKEEQRRIVLKALREVCVNELHWKEIKNPALQDENNPLSPIIYEVDTYTSGRIEFKLKLEGINVYSDITDKDDKCFKTFDELSDELRKFGVETKFERGTILNHKPIGKEKEAKSLNDNVPSPGGKNTITHASTRRKRVIKKKRYKSR